MAQAEQVLTKALALSPIKRAELVEKILSSFEFPSRAKIDTLWAIESENRIEAFERGEIKTTSAQKIFKLIDKQKKK